MGQVLTIKEVKIAKSGTGAKGAWNLYSVIFADGTKASTFDNKLATLAGSAVDVEIIPEEKNPAYKKIKSWVLAGPTGAPAATSPAQITNPPIPPKTAPAPVSRDDNINAAVAIKEIGECLRANVGLMAKIEIPTGLTELYWNWIRHSLGAAIPKQSAQEPDEIPF